VTVPAHLKAALQREVKDRGLPNVSAGVTQLLDEALGDSARGRREDVLLAQVRTLGLRFAKLETDLRARDTLIVELLTTHLRVFLSHTAPPDANERDELKRSALDRFSRLMDGVEQRLAAGEAVLDEVPELVADRPPAPIDEA
jgi:hypothetical protein